MENHYRAIATIGFHAVADEPLLLLAVLLRLGLSHTIYEFWREIWRKIEGKIVTRVDMIIFPYIHN